MDKVIVTVLLIIAAVTASVLVINSVLPAVGSSAGAVASAADKMDDRIRSQVSIIHITSELDASGNWVDSDSDGKFDVFIWVKNVGTSRITGIDQSDLFFGQTSNYARIPYVTYAGTQYAHWQYQVENGSEWTNTTTLKITIHYSAKISQGTYSTKFIIPNGISDESETSF